MANKKAYDENIKSNKDSGEPSDDDLIVWGLESEEEVFRYRISHPLDKTTDEFLFIIQKIRFGEEITDEQSDFLDSIDSRYVGHIDNRKITKRESICLFLNQYWDWTNLELPKIRNVAVNVRPMYKEYVKFCRGKGFMKKNIMQYNEMKEYLSRYAKIKRYRGVDRHGKKSNSTSAVGMPLYRNLENVPSFDVSKVLE